MDFVQRVFDLIDTSVEVFYSAKSTAQFIVASTYPHARLINSICFALSAAIRIRSMQKEKKFYWLHAFALIIFMGYGGGLFTPVLMGNPSALVTNDVLIGTAFLAFMLTHVYDFTAFFTIRPVAMVIAWFTAVFRANTICNTLAAANAMVTPTAYYPAPFFGPVFVGTLSSSFGIFLPADVGIKPIQNGTPFGLQAPLIASIFTQLMVYDKTGAAGTYLRAMVGTYSEGEMRLFIAVMYATSYFLTILFEKEVNIFSPIYRVIYMLVPIQGPRTLVSPVMETGAIASDAKKEDLRVHVGGWTFAALADFESFMDVARMALVAVVAGVYLQVNKDEVIAKAREIFLCDN